MQVKEIMTKGPACCQPDTGLPEVAQMMADNDCGCIPVVDNKQNMNPVGTVTDRDIALRSFAAGQNPMDLKASDIMTTSIVSVDPNTSVEDCCNLMEDEQIRRVLVVDENGACCGIVAQADVAQHASPDQTAEVVREVSGSRTFSGIGMPAFGSGTRSYSNGGSTFHTESVLTFFAGLGSGAALMYFLDPDRGRRRRALVSDQAAALANDAQKALGRKQRDLQNRAQGLWAETRKAVTGSATAPVEKDEPGGGPEIGRAAAQR